MRQAFARAVMAATGIAAIAGVLFSAPVAGADTLRIGVLGGKAVSDDFAAQKCLAHDLADGLSAPVQILALPSGDELRQALIVGAVDMAALSTRSYSALWRAHPGAVQPVLATLGRGGAMGYRAVALSRPGAEIDTLDRLKGKNIGFADRRSMPGYFVPSVALERAGLNTEGDLKSVQFGGGYHATLTALESGAVDAALTWRSDSGADSVSGAGPLQRFQASSHTNFIEFWRSPLMPNGPVVLRKALPESIKKIVTNRIAALGETAPDCLAMAFGLPVTGVFPVTHADYETFIVADHKRISLSVASN
ncbi:PhnD/SsuA/transferrin family substrate-binding protein [Nisaea sp.]|uniref:PhnD/SsuA/transferrin family substrate-binding protein n=1 Tax=Nisaea sp. TaxID=2024842 RepID=UPI002B27722F|nr:PhnD/SsuA/transferrin family substrate-binding protein [Nisaea sp.]